jgi:hypothetical protein
MHILRAAVPCRDVAQCCYLLLTAPTGFGLSCWPSSGSSLVLLRQQLLRHTVAEILQYG